MRANRWKAVIDLLPEWVSWVPWAATIILFLYPTYTWVLLAVAVVLSLITHSLVFVLGWCVLTAAYFVGSRLFLLADRRRPASRGPRSRGRKQR